MTNDSSNEHTLSFDGDPTVYTAWKFGKEVWCNLEG